MDSQKTIQPDKTAAKLPSPRKYPPIRLLAVAGLLVGFGTGFALKFQAESTARTLALKAQHAAQMALKPSYAKTVENVAIIEYSPMVAED